MYGGMLNTYQIKKEDTFKHTSSIEPGFNIDGYNHAKKILNWSTNENHLRKLVYEVTKNEELSNSLDYNDLKHQYHRIFGVAKKILKSEE